jgi:hypothetical protein
MSSIKGKIALELMQLYSHLRAAADPHVKTTIRQQIDQLVRKAEELEPEDAASAAPADAIKDPKKLDPTPG